MSRKQALDDPIIAQTAWGRFRRLMGWMAAWGAVLVAAVLAIFYAMGGPMPIHMILAISLGVWLTFMLGTALMTLSFLSSGTGHDEQIEDFLKEEAGYDDQR